jgi:hypothetical protein
MAGGKLMLNIEKELFQWEKGRYVIVNDESITTVEFYNKKSKYSDEVIVENGQAQIPNKLLKESLPIAALACIDDENGTKVISRKTFKVLARPRPEFYVDDEDEPINPGPDIPGLDIIYDGGVVL